MRTIAENANDFADLRTADGGNCIYVDKTDYFHRLVTAGSKKLFFIARPRRFGKSLMITTFKYIFERRRELFKGLKIGRTDYDWKVHPVIHLNFGFCAASTYAGFMEGFPNTVKQALLKAGFDYVAGDSPAVNLGNAIEWFFAKGTPCVILIDEYDDPVANASITSKDASHLSLHPANVDFGDPYFVDTLETAVVAINNLGAMIALDCHVRPMGEDVPFTRALGMGYTVGTDEATAIPLGQPAVTGVAVSFPQAGSTRPQVDVTLGSEPSGTQYLARVTVTLKVDGVALASETVDGVVNGQTVAFSPECAPEGGSRLQAEVRVEAAGAETIVDDTTVVDVPDTQPAIEDITLSFPDGYSRASVDVTMGGLTAGSIYSATVAVQLYTNGYMYGEASLASVTNGQTVEGASGGTVLENCLFYGNSTYSAENGGGNTSGNIRLSLAAETDTVEIRNCTIAYNYNDDKLCASGVSLTKGDLKIVNSIIYDNVRNTSAGASTGADLWVRAAGRCDVSYSIITADTNANGSATSIVTADPSRLTIDRDTTKFVDPLFVTDRETAEKYIHKGSSKKTKAFLPEEIETVMAFNLHLRGGLGYCDETTGGLVADYLDKPGSPAIDAGDPKDSRKNERRPHGPRVNMGAYGNTPWATMSTEPGLMLFVR